MSFRRRSAIRRPVSVGHDITRIVEFGTATGTAWSPTRMHKPGDIIAILGSLSSLLKTYPGDQDGLQLGTDLGAYTAIAQRIMHSPAISGGTNAAFNSIAVMLMGNTQSLDSFLSAWESIGHSLYEAVQTLPENVATQYWRMVRALVDQTTIAQMPGYMFGQPFQVPVPPQPGGNLPGGGPNPLTPSAPRQASAPASLLDTIAAEAADWAPEILGAAGAIAGSGLGPVGSAVVAAGAAKIGDIIQERYGASYRGWNNLSASDRRSIAEEALRRAQRQQTGVESRGYDPRQEQQQPLPNVPTYPEPGQTNPGSTTPQSAPGRTPGALENLVPASYGGGTQGIGGTAGRAAGQTIGGIAGGEQTGQAAGQLGQLGGEGVQALVEIIRRGT